MTLPWGHLFFIDSYRGKNTENFLSLIKSGERYRTIMVLLFDKICSKSSAAELPYEGKG